jgi:hypothetical protein
MRHRLLAGLALLVFVPALWGLDDDKSKSKPDQPKTPEQEFTALAQQYQADFQAVLKDYRAAKNNEERQKLLQERYYPLPNKYAGKMLELAEKHPNDPAAIKALVWVVQNSRGGNDAGKAVDLLMAHAESPQIGDICPSLARTGNPKAEKLLRTIMEKNPKREAKAYACFFLADALKEKGDQGGPRGSELDKEAEGLFERFVKDYADVKFNGMALADMAKGGINEIQHLRVGKEAPDIVGEDIDGKPFKLSDYRGKVVMLDFWGHW